MKRLRIYGMTLAVLLGAGIVPARAEDETAALQKSISQTQAIKDDVKRIQAFRALAEKQAKAQDAYAALGAGGMPTPPADAEDMTPFHKELTDAIEATTSEAIARTLPGKAEVGSFIPPIVHGDALAMSAEDVRRLAPPLSATVSMRMQPYDDNPYNVKLVNANGRADFMQRQQTALPEIISLEEGVMTLPMLAQELNRAGAGNAITQEGEIFTLSRPLVIGPNAALLIDGKEVKELRLSQEAGAYIVNAGKLFVLDSRVTGWSQSAGAPAWSEPSDELTFRPFVLSWSRSQTYFAHSVFTALGYENSKSYGITLSAGPERMLRFGAEDIHGPHAVMIENSFRNLHYGFYCFETDDALIVGNEYVDNVIYGIDPHDYSNRLLIAYNTIYGSKKKHGIIISREVNDSAIIGNLSFANKGSGIMVERNSSDALVYANTSLANKQDGLSLYESSCGIHAGNYLAENERMGINIRNSKDIGLFRNTAIGNAHAGIQGYALDLFAAENQQDRNFDEDPYSDLVAFSAVDNRIEANGQGLQTDKMAAFYMRGNRFVHQSPKLAKGDWSSLLPQAFTEHNQEKAGVFVARSCSPAKVYLDQPCRMREQGYLSGDGQKGLSGWMSARACEGAVQ